MSGSLMQSCCKRNVWQNHCNWLIDLYDHSSYYHVSVTLFLTVSVITLMITSVSVPTLNKSSSIAYKPRKTKREKGRYSVSTSVTVRNNTQ